MNTNTREALKEFIRQVMLFSTVICNDANARPDVNKALYESAFKLQDALNGDETIP